jgi:hypothetical protein
MPTSYCPGRSARPNPYAGQFGQNIHGAIHAKGFDYLQRSLLAQPVIVVMGGNRRFNGFLASHTFAL